MLEELHQTWHTAEDPGVALNRLMVLENAEVPFRYYPPRVDWNSRDSLIAFLNWNDHNGCYSDEDAIAEGFEPFTLETARLAVINAMEQSL